MRTHQAEYTLQAIVCALAACSVCREDGFHRDPHESDACKQDLSASQPCWMRCATYHFGATRVQTQLCSNESVVVEPWASRDNWNTTSLPKPLAHKLSMAYMSNLTGAIICLYAL